VINSLKISNLEVRDEEDEEIKQYTHGKDVQLVVVPKEEHLRKIENGLFALADAHILPWLRESFPGHYIKKDGTHKDARFWNDFGVWAPAKYQEYDEGLYAHLHALWSAWYCRMMLITHNVEASAENFRKRLDMFEPQAPKESDSELKRRLRIRRFEVIKSMQGTPEFRYLEELFDDTDGKAFRHAKLDKLAEVLTGFYGSD
jgi:ERCC4-related helicase